MNWHEFESLSSGDYCPRCGSWVSEPRLLLANRTVYCCEGCSKAWEHGWPDECRRPKPVRPALLAFSTTIHAWSLFYDGAGLCLNLHTRTGTEWAEAWDPRTVLGTLVSALTQPSVSGTLSVQPREEDDT